MRNLHDLDACRRRNPRYRDLGDGGNGWFLIASPVDGMELRCLASNGGGWEHVSVSRADRIPDWNEMSFIARTFFPHEDCMQLHVPAKDHISVCGTCLHLWRPVESTIPRPPSIMVAP